MFASEISKESIVMQEVLIIVFVVMCIAFCPLACIWALNTLFGLTIAYTFKTWLAALVLAGIVCAATK